jgi:type IV pilus assembly protein PilF
MGLSYLRRGELDRAMERLQKAESMDPDAPGLKHYFGELYSRLDQPEKAEEYFRDGIEADPDDSGLRNNFAVFLCSRERWQEAETHFMAAAGNPAYATPHVAYENAARCAMRQPDARKAEKYFREALSLQPRLPNSLRAMAELQFDKREFLSARAYLQRYFEVAAKTAHTLWLGVRIERQLGDEAQARKYGEQLLDDYPRSREAELFASLLDNAGLAKPGGAGQPIEVIVSDEVLNGDTDTRE